MIPSIQQSPFSQQELSQPEQEKKSWYTKFSIFNFFSSTQQPSLKKRQFSISTEDPPVGLISSVIEFYPTGGQSQHSDDGYSSVVVKKSYGNILQVTTNEALPFGVFSSKIPQTDSHYWITIDDGLLQIPKDGKTPPKHLVLGEENPYVRDTYSTTTSLLTSAGFGTCQIAKWNVENVDQPKQVFFQKGFEDVYFLEGQTKFFGFHDSYKKEQRIVSIQLWNFEKGELEWECLNNETNPWFKNPAERTFFEFLRTPCPLPNTVVGVDNQYIYFINYQKKEIKSIEIVQDKQPKKYPCLRWIKFINDERLICRFIGSDTLLIYDLTTGDLSKKIQVGTYGPRESDGCPTLVKDETVIALNPKDDHEICYWSAITGDLQGSIQLNKNITQLYFSPSQQQIIGLNDDHEMYIWDYTTKALLKFIKMEDNSQLLHLSSDIMIIGTANFNNSSLKSSSLKSKGSLKAKMSLPNQEFSTPFQFAIKENKELIVSFQIYDLNQLQQVTEQKHMFYPAKNWFGMEVSLVLVRTTEGISVEAWQCNKKGEIILSKFTLYKD